ncbi:hypothetical protein NL108_007627, partial [Boleophthalmus pectinirostris]
QCEHGCKHGECVGPNKCKCFPGYTGKTCNQDLNECGLKPRPCEHRCMNTHGSYKCYCLNGYTLMPDGSCANSRTCSLAHCQYGCEEVQGEIHCICPSTGLQLGQDERTCVDVDECVTGKNLCPYNRQCVNTFGSYFCKCQEGYDLKYIDGKYDCVDLDECVSGSHKCSHHAVCLNTQGSYKCRCKAGFRGNGFECSGNIWTLGFLLVMSNAVAFLPAVIPESPVKPGKHQNEDIKNIIPEPAVTEPSKVRQQPFDYDGEVYIGNPDEERPTEITEEDEEEENNQLNPRGDVFVSEDFESVFGPTTEVKEIEIVPVQEGKRDIIKFAFMKMLMLIMLIMSFSSIEFIMDCNFDQGGCEWVQDKSDDMDWSVAYHDRAEYYMAMSGFLGEQQDIAKLKLLLSDRAQQGSFCLTFDFRVVGHNVGTLRVLLDNNVYPIWEQSQSQNHAWQTEFLTVAWREKAPEM